MPGNLSQHVVIVGGGTAGLTVAAILARRGRGTDLSISLIEPSADHYYESAFPLVGAGAVRLHKTCRSEEGLIPRGVDWFRDRVIRYQPEAGLIELHARGTMTYDYLVVCTGLEPDWERIEGGREALGKNGVCSIYTPEHADYTWNCLQNLGKGAAVVFTQPPTAIKNPGAPQAMAFLTADYLKKRRLLDSCTLRIFTHAGKLFPVPMFNNELDKAVTRYGIKMHYHHKLVGVDLMNKKASFKVLSGKNKGKSGSIAFDMLHITPPQSPPESIRSSPLAGKAGFVEVNRHTLQHVRFSHVFAAGDCGSVPTAKTASATRKQASVVVRNLLAMMKGNSLDHGYDGYSSSSLTTAYGKAIKSEFIYSGKVTPTLPLDPRKERRLNWWIDKFASPFFYWNYILKGREWFLPHNRDYVEPGD